MNGFGALAPLLIIVGAALVILLLDAFLKKDNKNYLAYLSLFFLAVCAVFCLRSWNKNLSYFEGQLRLDNLALFLAFLFLITVAFVMFIGMKYLTLQNVHGGEFYGLLLLALSGLMIMTS